MESCDNLLPLVCQSCGGNFENQAVLDMHMKTHFPKVQPVTNESKESPDIEFPCECRICGERFENEEVLDLHMESPHKPYYWCCNRYFKSIKAVDAHKKAKHSDSNSAPAVTTSYKARPKKCMICKKWFDFKYLLVKHFKTHHSKELVCGGCNKHFTCRFALERHRKSAHSKEKCRMQK